MWQSHVILIHYSIVVTNWASGHSGLQCECAKNQTRGFHFIKANPEKLSRNTKKQHRISEFAEYI